VFMIGPTVFHNNWAYICTITSIQSSICPLREWDKCLAGEKNKDRHPIMGGGDTVFSPLENLGHHEDIPS